MVRTSLWVRCIIGDAHQSLAKDTSGDVHRDAVLTNENPLYRRPQDALNLVGRGLIPGSRCFWYRLQSTSAVPESAKTSTRRCGGRKSNPNCDLTNSSISGAGIRTGSRRLSSGFLMTACETEYRYRRPFLFACDGVNRLPSRHRAVP
jgi:hypothetical protein